MTPYSEDEQRVMDARCAAIESAIRESVREALLQHKRAGNPVPYWDGQQVQWLPAEQIDVGNAPG
jgi:hypothetical protein